MHLKNAYVYPSPSAYLKRTRCERIPKIHVSKVNTPLCSFKVPECLQLSCVHLNVGTRQRPFIVRSFHVFHSPHLASLWAAQNAITAILLLTLS